MHIAAFVVFCQPEPQITLDLPATRLPEIAKKITEATGGEVKIIGPDPSQFVFLNVEKMPFFRLRESLAFVTGGKWIKTGETWNLQTIPEEALVSAADRQALQNWPKSHQRMASLRAGLWRV